MSISKAYELAIKGYDVSNIYYDYLKRKTKNKKTIERYKDIYLLSRLMYMNIHNETNKYIIDLIRDKYKFKEGTNRKMMQDFLIKKIGHCAAQPPRINS